MVRGWGWWRSTGEEHLRGHLETDFSFPWEQGKRLFLKHIGGAEPPRFGALNEWSWGLAYAK